MRILNQFLLFSLFLISLAVCSMIISGNAAAVDSTWTNGAGDGKASTSGNWDNGIGEGFNLIYDSTSTANCNFDYSGELGTISINLGYSGIITQSSDMHTSGYDQKAATLTGDSTKNFYCGGDFLKSGGVITNGKINLVMIGSNSEINLNAPMTFKSLKIDDHICSLTSPSIIMADGLNITNNGILNITTGTVLSFNCYYSYNNDGSIIGNGAIYLVLTISNSDLDFKNVDCNVYFKLLAAGSGNRIFNIKSDMDVKNLYVVSEHATYTCSVDFADYNITASSITIGIRGILLCGEGIINSGSLDSSAGTLTNETATWVFTNNAMVKMAAGGTLYDVEVNGTSLRLGSDVTMNSLTFCGLTASHPYGLYINGTRASSVTTTSSGIYSLGSGVFAWDNATLKITPVITIDGWERTDGGLRNVVWEGYDYWADHDADAAVSWTLSGTSWLSTDANGNITGEAGDDGTYYYTLTATAANGEEASVSGFIIVENSINEGLDVAFSWLSPLIGLMAIGFLAVALSALSGSWTKKK